MGVSDTCISTLFPPLPLSIAVTPGLILLPERLFFFEGRKDAYQWGTSFIPSHISELECF